MRVVVSARWILPIGSRPIPNGWVAIDGDRVAATGTGPVDPPFDRGQRLDLPRAAVMPGLVNAHTHLELSGLRGRVPPAPDMVSWVRRLLATRGSVEQEVQAIEAGIAEARRCGTALVGDISNTLATVGPLAASAMSAVVFKELLQFTPADPEKLVAAALADLRSRPFTADVRPALAAHAPYSVSPALFRAIASAVTEWDAPLGIHLAESAAELELLDTGMGDWRRLLEDLGAWDGGWTAPGTNAVGYLDQLGFIGPRLVAAHGVQLTDPELRRLADAGATLVTCPRSNRWTGVGDPPVERFYASGVRVAVGTDSLSSAPDLNLWSELRELRRIAPDVPAGSIIESATRHGAEALRFGAELGSIATGMRSALIAVDLLEGTADVEEYLVSGVEPDRVRWIDELLTAAG